MSYRGVKALLLACSGAGALLAATADANAGGFAVREQSAFGQGSSYAGIAAGGALSALFWNPATMTQMPGLRSESVLSGIIPYSANTPGAGSTLTSIGYGGTDNVAKSALVPASYYSWQVNPDLWLGLSINAPFGLSETFPVLWAGRDYGTGGTTLKTYNATPSLAYRFNDMISVGFGVQIQYAKADLSRGPTPFIGSPVNAFVPFNAELSGHGWGFGFTAGVTLMPTPTTTIGIGYRSAINQKIKGSLSVTGPFPLPGTTNGDIETTVDLPDVVSLGLRQKVGPQWTLLGTVEWSNWSRIGTSTVSQSNGGPATVGGHPVTIPFEYDDGWLFSVGAEYQWSENLAVRGGFGYEKSPISDHVRDPLVPDNDRYWLSVGGTYQYNKALSFDIAYSHLFVKDTPINVSAASGNPSFDGITYIGDVDSHVDIISVAMHYRWDEPAAAPSKGPMYTKAR
jgi:long-chain fatty acid transport protein